MSKLKGVYKMNKNNEQFKKLIELIRSLPYKKEYTFEEALSGYLLSNNIVVFPTILKRITIDEEKTSLYNNGIPETIIVEDLKRHYDEIFERLKILESIIEKAETESFANLFN